MNPIKLKRGVAPLVLFVALTIGAGCSDSNFALIGRDTLPNSSSLPVENEIVATVERLDTGSREIRLRPSDGRTTVVVYSPDARALYRGREYPVSQLEVGDIVALQLRQDSRGNSYTDLIRVQESIRDRSQSRSDISKSVFQTLDGRVEQLDVQRRSFEIRDQSKERVVVTFPSNPQASDVDHFRALRNGDYVRFEGRFLDRQRFELVSFLRDNR